MTRSARTTRGRAALGAGIGLVLVATAGGPAATADDAAGRGPLRAGASAVQSVPGFAGYRAAPRFDAPAGAVHGLVLTPEPGYVVLDDQFDSADDAANSPELGGAIMGVPADDRSTPDFDESTLLVFRGHAVGAPTVATDQAGVALDTNGDLIDDYWISTPSGPLAADTNVAVPVSRVVGDTLVGTGQLAVWRRTTDSYLAALDWRALGLTSVRFVFGLSDGSDITEPPHVDWSPDDYTGALIVLPPQPVVRVKVASSSHRSKLRVDVNPNKGKGYWTFQVQKMAVNGTWVPGRTYRTSGSAEKRTLNLPKGTYRVWVNPRYGYAGTYSGVVTLKR